MQHYDSGAAVLVCGSSAQFKRTQVKTKYKEMCINVITQNTPKYEKQIKKLKSYKSLTVYTPPPPKKTHTHNKVMQDVANTDM